MDDFWTETLNRWRVALECAACGRVFREADNIGRWLCRQHNDEHDGARWGCCDAASPGARGCARADHCTTALGFDFAHDLGVPAPVALAVQSNGSAPPGVIQFEPQSPHHARQRALVQGAETIVWFRRFEIAAPHYNAAPMAFWSNAGTDSPGNDGLDALPLVPHDDDDDYRGGSCPAVARAVDQWILAAELDDEGVEPFDQMVVQEGATRHNDVLIINLFPLSKTHQGWVSAASNRRVRVLQWSTLGMKGPFQGVNLMRVKDAQGHAPPRKDWLGAVVKHLAPRRIAFLVLNENDAQLRDAWEECKITYAKYDDTVAVLSVPSKVEEDEFRAQWDARIMAPLRDRYNIDGPRTRDGRLDGIAVLQARRGQTKWPANKRAGLASRVGGTTKTGIGADLQRPIEIDDSTRGADGRVNAFAALRSGQERSQRTMIHDQPERRAGVKQVDAFEVLRRGQLRAAQGGKHEEGGPTFNGGELGKI